LTILEDLQEWLREAVELARTIPAGATSGPLLVSVAPSMNDSNVVQFAVTWQPLPPSWLDQDVGAEKKRERVRHVWLFRWRELDASGG